MCILSCVSRYMDSSIVLPTLIIGGYGVALADRYYYPTRRMDIKWMGLSFLSLITAFICRVLDVQRLWVFPGPDTWLQGHSFWHLFTSLSIYYLYVHHRSEPTYSTGIFTGVGKTVSDRILLPV